MEGDSISASPRNKWMGKIADALRAGRDFGDKAHIPDFVPLLGGMGIGTYLVGKAPEEFNEWSYGNSPIQMGYPGMSSHLPQIKNERKQQLIDALLTTSAVVPTVYQGGKKILKEGARQIETGTGIGKIVADPRQYMFVGETSKTWNKTAAAKAQEMAKAGIDPEVIWKKTGTFQGPDLKWRQEIPDDLSKISDNVYDGIKANKEFQGPMSQALTHEKLYKAYPEVGDIKAGVYAQGKPAGTYSAPTNTVTVGGPTTGHQRSVALHEIQHAIQNKEGWARGGSADGLPEALTNDANSLHAAARKLFDAGNLHDGWALEKQAGKLDSRVLWESPDKLYRRLAGETEARLTQNRMYLNPSERAASYPPSMFDVPVKDQIVRYGNGQAMSVHQNLLDALRTK